MTFFLVLLLILGLVFGSFISALTWRYPKKISVLRGRSICPNCRKQISWFDNIPLLSFIVLRGKCRNCKKKISFRYPLIELSGALGFLLVGNYFYPNLLSIIYFLIIYCVLTSILVIDLEHQIIPDNFVFWGIAVSFSYTLFFIPDSLFSAILAGLISASFLLLVHLATHGRGMGLGDVKFAILGGLIVGLKLTFIWLLIAFLTGGIAGIILILAGRAHLKTKVAFGPFLVFAIFLALVFGNQYLRLLGF